MESREFDRPKTRPKFCVPESKHPSGNASGIWSRTNRFAQARPFRRMTPIMVTSDLGACEWFVWDLRRSGLIDRGQLDQIVGEFLKRNPRAEAPALAEYLVQQGTLTQLPGRAHPQRQDRRASSSGRTSCSTPSVQGAWARSTRPPRRTTTRRTPSRCCPAGACGTSASPAGRCGRSASSSTRPSSRSWTSAPPAACTTSSGRSSKARRSNRSSPTERPAHRGAVGPCRPAGRPGACTAAHQNSLFHGLLKPSNIMIGSDNQARILDFGIGSLLVENEGESLVDTMSTANTLTSGLDCSSPESIMEPTNRTPAGDQYSLGCMLYYCLTGPCAVPGRQCRRKDDGPPVEGADADPRTCPGHARRTGRGRAELMAKNPEERYTGCDEVVEALEPYLGDPRSIPGGMPAHQAARGGGGGSGGMPAVASRAGGGRAAVGGSSPRRCRDFPRSRRRRRHPVGTSAVPAPQRRHRHRRAAEHRPQNLAPRAVRRSIFRLNSQKTMMGSTQA